jgi:hypothetical protein
MFHPDMDRHLSDRGIKRHRLSDRFLRRSDTSDYFDERRQMWEIRRIPNQTALRVSAGGLHFARYQWE